MVDKQTDEKGDRLLCPSARCRAGARLLGVVTKSGTIEFMPEQIVIDDQFVRIARQGRAPEKRFRFADNCLQCGCVQWKNERCSVADIIVEEPPLTPSATELPECGIRSRCRWFHQLGVSACKICPEVVRNPREEASPAPSLENTWLAKSYQD